MLTPIKSYSLVVEMATGHAPFADDVLFGCVSKCEYTVAPQNDRKFLGDMFVCFQSRDFGETRKLR